MGVRDMLGLDILREAEVILCKWPFNRVVGHFIPGFFNPLKGNDFIICIFQIQSPNFFLIISASFLASTIGQIIKSIIMCVNFFLFDPF